MMWWWSGQWGGWAWLAMTAAMVVFWGVIIWIFVTVVRRSDGGSGRAHGDPEQILKERFARGEIDEMEYERRREVLRR